jgi:hypothetical protein
MNPVEAASPPQSPLGPRRATLRARPSGLKGRCRDRCATGHSPPLTPEPLRPLTEQRHGQAQGAARRARGAEHQEPRSNPYNQVSTVTGDCHPRRTMAHR